MSENTDPYHACFSSFLHHCHSLSYTDFCYIADPASSVIFTSLSCPAVITTHFYVTLPGWQNHISLPAPLAVIYIPGSVMFVTYFPLTSRAQHHTNPTCTY